MTPSARRHCAAHRWRRLQLDDKLREEVLPKNI